MATLLLQCRGWFLPSTPRTGASASLWPPPVGWMVSLPTLLYQYQCSTCLYVVSLKCPLYYSHCSCRCGASWFPISRSVDAALVRCRGKRLRRWPHIVPEFAKTWCYLERSHVIVDVVSCMIICESIWCMKNCSGSLHRRKYRFSLDLQPISLSSYHISFLSRNTRLDAKMLSGNTELLCVIL